MPMFCQQPNRAERGKMKWYSTLRNKEKDHLRKMKGLISSNLWALKSYDGELVVGFMHIKRDHVKQDAEANLECSWQELYRDGWRIVKVELREVKK